MMRMSTIVRLGALAAAALFAARCSSSSNPNNPTPPPTPPAVTTVVTGVQAADGTQATQQAGSPPAASGGPTITASASSSVIPNGTEVATLTSAQSFQTVYVSVPSNNSIMPAGVFSPNALGPRDATTGFFQLRLATPVTSAVIIVNLAGVSTGSRFTIAYQVASASGAVGAPVSSSRSVVNSAPGVQVAVSWNTPTDVDLHVVEPSGNEVFWGATSSSTGGQLDQDSNPACALDNRNVENIRWNNSAPNGTYIVRVDYWSACAVTGSTNFTVTVVNGGQRSTFTGSFTANQADAGGRGSGREINRFNHTTGISPFSITPVNLEPLSFPSPLKLMMSRQPE